MAWISFRVQNVCEALKTQKNPRHVPCPLKSNRTAVGLTRQSIPFGRLLRRWMDARVKPAHDDRIVFGTPPALHRTATQGLRAALRPGNESSLKHHRIDHH